MKKSILYYLLWCLIMSVALVSCSDDNESGSGVENEQPAVYTIKLTAPQKKVLSQSNDFAFDVLKSINDENTNNFVSPYSLGQALAMLANGAEGETYDEIARVLKIGDGASLADINTFYATSAHLHQKFCKICRCQFALDQSKIRFLPIGQLQNRYANPLWRTSASARFL